MPKGASATTPSQFTYELRPYTSSSLSTTYGSYYSVASVAFQISLEARGNTGWEEELGFWLGKGCLENKQESPNKKQINAKEKTEKTQTHQNHITSRNLI